MSQRSEKIWEDFVKNGAISREELEKQTALVAAAAEARSDIKVLERRLQESRSRLASLLEECVHVKPDATGAFTPCGPYDTCGVCGDMR